MKNILRLWDTYLSKSTQTVTLFHLCACAAFLTTWSEKLRTFDFSEAIVFLQNLVNNSQESMCVEGPSSDLLVH